MHIDDYCLGCDVIGGGAAIIGDLKDYSWGMQQVEQLRQYFESLGRPPEFEARVQGIWAAYESVRTSFATIAYVRGDAMKAIGKDAAALMVELQNAMQAKAKASGAAAPRGVPPTGSQTNPDDKPRGVTDAWATFLKTLPWVAGGVVLVVGGLSAAPFIARSIARARAASPARGR